MCVVRVFDTSPCTIQYLNFNLSVTLHLGSHLCESRVQETVAVCSLRRRSGFNRYKVVPEELSSHRKLVKKLEGKSLVKHYYLLKQRGRSVMDN